MVLDMRVARVARKDGAEIERRFILFNLNLDVERWM